MCSLRPLIQHSVSTSNTFSSNWRHGTNPLWHGPTCFCAHPLSTHVRTPATTLASVFFKEIGLVSPPIRRTFPSMSVWLPFVVVVLLLVLVLVLVVVVVVVAV